MGYFTFTGNPFVDAGLLALLAWNCKKSLEDLNLNDLDEITEITSKLYNSERWRKNLYSVFPNNPFTNPSVKEKENKYLEFMADLKQNIKPLNTGYGCAGCGVREPYKKFTKTDVPLTGTRDLRNHFPAAEDGENYCALCAMLVQFMPLVLFSCGGRFMLVHSVSEELNYIYVRQCINEVKRQIALGDLTGIYDKGYKNPVNAVFFLAEEIVRDLTDLFEEPIAVRIYNFTNYNQSPDLSIYDLPARVFYFIVRAKRKGFWREWQELKAKGYTGKRAENATEEEKKNLNNEVLNKLLNEESVVSYFVNPQNRTITGNFEFLSLYLKEVRGYMEKRIETIKRVGDELARYIKETDDTRRLFLLEKANSYDEFRNQLRIIYRKRFEKGVSTPLFTLDEYMEDLFPEGPQNWKETRDLLLFRIYETLSGWLTDKPLEFTEEEEKE
ncbi:type I-B CRISPR-associated protein Cas8b1/Cst1 [Carboxydothermus pertinax]|uniref:Type I-B CRISPR-associated protein Cas8b1/Cst1 n=1 Tax=Carboxydothermus pertinax TaxID=870242 RepID=A0A1L8CWN9_9THEO|nr:type I-B CRISPR-associated protein Cas8b1/Cst1 [Carboxydothermus pertinax]GAV23301.1 type I-B CRISPR-associated protein Cas8b1/Cst1 [Carboxydothermus pertinax]